MIQISESANPYVVVATFPQPSSIQKSKPLLAKQIRK